MIFRVEYSEEDLRFCQAESDFKMSFNFLFVILMKNNLFDFMIKKTRTVGDGNRDLA